ncbi:MAG: STAS domain-containing protein [Armatimonadetes bacterium]|nr:STAS domain-containing protein [Armatimonadota bacterium]
MIVESAEDTIKLSGDLTSNQWEAIRTVAAILLKKHPRGVVVDCEGIRFCTPDGAQTFFDMMTHIESRKARIIVANVPEHCKEVLQHVPEVRSGLAIADSVEEARHSLELLDELTVVNSRPPHTTGKLVLSLTGGPADPYATSLAAAIAERRQLAVVAVYPLVVPRALPKSTPMRDEEDAAADALQKAKNALDGRGLLVEPTLERTRSVPSALQKVTQDAAGRAVVVALPAEDPAKGEPLKTVKGLLTSITAELILVREPGPQTDTEQEAR